ncbi:glycerol-3-phosphate 1-O-acyltransferase PlsY [Candidatus Phytoplasma pyri]|uniref:glycerol-3-phosphate 1-O-acyltransferase PlsY n=1 Tax=Candidatus Phytoplasma pyri TaxID=47566 RepID=UPI0039833439
MLNISSDFLLFINNFFIAISFYFVGSFPTGLVIGKLFKKKDLRFLGSKNIGTSNAARILGFKYGLVTCFFDFFKGFLAVFFFKENNYRIIFGLFSILGHIYPFFTNFKGGKAVATTVGMFCGLEPVCGLLGMLFFIIIFLISGYSSLSSILTIFFIYILFLFVDSVGKFELITIFFINIIILFKHKKNILNLINKNEYKFNFKK